jgi:predicted ATPase
VETKLIAITGGPGAGKTAVLEMARRSFCSHVAILPEAASIVFGGGFPRRESDVARRSAQRAIFNMQRELETLIVGESLVAIALCDRGTVDGLAYWPDSDEAYWQEVGSTQERELARYAAVIHLETPGVAFGYNHDNALRIESAKEAKAIDARIAAAWSPHSHRLLVSSQQDFEEKALRALRFIRAELPDCCRSHPLQINSEADGP